MDTNSYTPDSIILCLKEKKQHTNIWGQVLEMPVHIVSTVKDHRGKDGAIHIKFKFFFLRQNSL